jgi:carboxylesterase type B
LFTGAVYRDAIQFASTGSDVYLWSFDYAAPEDEPNVPLDWQGVPHGYEVGFVFAYHNGNTQDSRDTIMKTGDFWSNFIIYG